MTVSRVGILGAGTMGRGIAQVAALGGYETRVYDAYPEAAEGAAVKIRGALAKERAAGVGARQKPTRPRTGSAPRWRSASWRDANC